VLSVLSVVNPTINLLTTINHRAPTLAAASMGHPIDGSAARGICCNSTRRTTGASSSESYAFHGPEECGKKIRLAFSGNNADQSLIRVPLNAMLQQMRYVGGNAVLDFVQLS
jgi:hypothetical protein